MLIQVLTDNHIDGSAALIQEIESAVEQTLHRFENRITRTEVHLSDENSRHKSHGEPIRCRLEVRPASHQPVSVTADGANIDQAVSGALTKMEKLLDSTFGRLDDPRG